MPKLTILLKSEVWKYNLVIIIKINSLNMIILVVIFFNYVILIWTVSGFYIYHKSTQQFIH